MTQTPSLKITLTPEQKQQIQKATGREVASLKLEALEARLSPGININ